MYGGRIIEMGSCADVIRKPAHPYTRGLLTSRAGHAAVKGDRLVAIPGAPPDLANLPLGCAFAPRCSHALDLCRQSIPDPVFVQPRHFACCLRLDAVQDQYLPIAATAAQ